MKITSVSSIDFATNKVNRDNEIKFLANGLTGNQSINRLSLMIPNIGDDALETLFNALKNNNSIANLDLSTETIGEKGIKALIGLLENNKKIIRFKFSIGNIYESINKSKIIDKIKENKSIIAFDVKGLPHDSKEQILSDIDKHINTNKTNSEKIVDKIMESISLKATGNIIINEKGVIDLEAENLPYHMLHSKKFMGQFTKERQYNLLDSLSDVNDLHRTVMIVPTPKLDVEKLKKEIKTMEDNGDTVSDKLVEKKNFVNYLENQILSESKKR